MRDQEIVGLYEAYQSIYSNVNEEVEQLDELSLETLKRARKARQKRIDDDIEAGRHDAASSGMDKLDRTKRMIRKKSNPDSVAGTPHFPAGSTSYQKEEVESWINALVEEGYDLSGYTWEAMCEMYLDEITKLGLEARRRAEHEGSRRRKSPEYRRGFRPPLGEREKNYRKLERRQSSQHADLETQKMTGDTGSHGDNYHQRLLNRDPEKNPKHNANRKNAAESFDFFDTILEYLVAEGYADTNEAAVTIMANMSEDWRQSILEQSAIGARAARVVKDQRDGYHGDADAIKQLQTATAASIGKLNRRGGPVVTPGLPGV